MSRNIQQDEKAIRLMKLRLAMQEPGSPDDQRGHTTVKPGGNHPVIIDDDAGGRRKST